MATKKQTEAEIRAQYHFSFQPWAATVYITADTVDEAVAAAVTEAVETGKTVSAWDFAGRHVATVKPDGSLGGNGTVTRYEF